MQLFEILNEIADVLKLAHKYLDDHNAEATEKAWRHLCSYCDSDQYNGELGIVHRDDCIIKRIRRLVNV